MLISCPKCRSVYNISDNQMLTQGKKIKCAECGNIWSLSTDDIKNIKLDNEVKPQIVSPMEKSEKKSDVDIMFDKFSEKTQSLFSNTDEKNVCFKNIMRKIYMQSTPIAVVGSLLVSIFLLAIFILYFNRYDVVRLVPKMEYLYEKFNIESIYSGRDLVFKDVDIQDIERGGQHFIEIYGKIYNQGNKTSYVLPVKAAITTQNGTIENETVKILTMPRLDAGYSTIFRIIFENNILGSKTLHLSFDKQRFIALREAKKKAQKEKQRALEKQKKADMKRRIKLGIR